MFSGILTATRFVHDGSSHTVSLTWLSTVETTSSRLPSAEISNAIRTFIKELDRLTSIDGHCPEGRCAVASRDEHDVPIVIREEREQSNARHQLNWLSTRSGVELPQTGPLVQLQENDGLAI